jgi:simple sugar transport system permease protein
MMPALDVLKDAGFWVSAIALATPFVFGALGALICARAGVIHLGIEGIFIAGALAGATAIAQGGGAWGGIVAASIAGTVFGILHATLTGPLRVSQPLAGIAVALLAVSLARVGAGAPGAITSAVAQISPFAPQSAAEIPAAAAALLQQMPLTFAALLIALVVAYILARTPLGLALRGCGDNPAAVEAQGRSVHGLRFGAIVAGSVLMALGGACLAFGSIEGLALNAVAGRGTVCLALAAAVAWRPLLAVAAALPFGAVAASAPYLSLHAGGPASANAPLVVIFILAIIAFTAAGRRTSWPADRSP